MKVRWASAGLVATVLAAGMLTPAGASAAPAATKPSGEAMVRIDGGTAQAVKRGSHLYRIVLPRGSSITWLGEVNSKLSVGTLGRKGLVAGWAKLGHNPKGTHAMTTITWQGMGDPQPTYRGAYVGKPRINRHGQMTFLAATVEALPSSLPSFSLNIARPNHRAPMVRSSSYPLVFPVNATSSTVGAQATATGDNTAKVVFGAQSGGVITSACGSPGTLTMTTSTVAPASYGFSGTCGDTTWSGGSVTFTSMQQGGSAQLQMQAAVVVMNNGTPSAFKWNFNMGQWRAGPVVVWPT